MGWWCRGRQQAVHNACNVALCLGSACAWAAQRAHVRRQLLHLAAPVQSGWPGCAPTPGLMAGAWTMCAGLRGATSRTTWRHPARSLQSVSMVAMGGWLVAVGIGVGRWAAVAVSGCWSSSGHKLLPRAILRMGCKQGTTAASSNLPACRPALPLPPLPPQASTGMRWRTSGTARPAPTRTRTASAPSTGSRLPGGSQRPLTSRSRASCTRVGAGCLWQEGHGCRCLPLRTSACSTACPVGWPRTSPPSLLPTPTS